MRTQGCWHRSFQFTPPRWWRPRHDRTGKIIKSFQFTPPRWWRRTAVRVTECSSVFQFTPPRWWRRQASGAQKTNQPFNSLHRVGGDTTLSILPIVVLSFQFTPPRWWRPNRAAKRCEYGYSFNSLHRVGGDSNTI